MLIVACINARRWSWVIGNVFLRTRFDISSGPGALLGDSLLIAFSSCLVVILLLHGTRSGYVEGMSLRLAKGGGGKKVDLNAAALSSFDMALLIVGMYRGIGVESMYFFRVHIVFSSAFSMKDLHVFLFAFLIS